MLTTWQHSQSAARQVQLVDLTISSAALSLGISRDACNCALPSTCYSEAISSYKRPAALLMNGYSFLSSDSKIKSNTEEVLTSCCAGIKISCIFRWGVNLDTKQCSSMVSGTGIYEDKLASWLAGQARWGEQRKSSLCFFCCLRGSGCLGVVHQAGCDLSWAAACIYINWTECMHCGVVFCSLSRFGPQASWSIAWDEILLFCFLR